MGWKIPSVIDDQALEITKTVWCTAYILSERSAPFQLDSSKWIWVYLCGSPHSPDSRNFIHKHMGVGSIDPRLAMPGVKTKLSHLPGIPGEVNHLPALLPEAYVTS